MLRIIDARTGEPVDAAPARRGLTRVEVHASDSDTTDLRVLLVADLLVRALELGGTPVWAMLTGGRRQAELRATAATLGIRPLEDSPDVGAGLGESQVIHVAAEAGAPPDGVRIAVAPVRRGNPGAPVGGPGVGSGARVGGPGGSGAPVTGPGGSGVPVTGPEESGAPVTGPGESGVPVTGPEESGASVTGPEESGAPVTGSRGPGAGAGGPGAPGASAGERPGGGGPAGERPDTGGRAGGSPEPGEPGARSGEPSHARSAERTPYGARSAERSPYGARSAERSPYGGRSATSTAPLQTVTDPAVLRLALLARHHSAPVRLEPAGLDDAGATLARWRGAVARWARRPSRPVPDDVRGRLRAAWEDDLDVPGVLDVLRHVETAPDLPDGARFETYAYADRLLGLELTRDLGAPS